MAKPDDNRRLLLSVRDLLKKINALALSASDSPAKRFPPVTLPHDLGQDLYLAERRHVIEVFKAVYAVSHAAMAITLPAVGPIPTGEGKLVQFDDLPDDIALRDAAANCAVAVSEIQERVDPADGNRFSPCVISRDTVVRLEAAASILEGIQVLEDTDRGPDRLTGFHSAREIATHLGLRVALVRKRLERMRGEDMDGNWWHEVTDRRPNQPRYLYDAERVGAKLVERTRRATE